MQPFAFQFNAQLDGVSELRPAKDDYALCIKLKCASCGEEDLDWHNITSSNVVQASDETMVNYVLNCQACGCEGCIKFESDPPLWRPYSSSDNVKTMCNVLFGGVVPLDVDVTKGDWTCKDKTGFRFKNVDLEEGEWVGNTKVDPDEEKEKEMAQGSAKQQKQQQPDGVCIMGAKGTWKML